MSGDHGKFSTDIGQDVIDAALKSVDKAKQKPGDDEVEVELETQPGVAPAAAAASQTEVDELKAQLEMSMESGRALTAKLKDEHERLLRATADLENFKKRAAKEKEELQKFGIEKLLKDFLPVLDNLDRALDHAAKGADVKGLESGVKMVRKLFEDTLAKHGVKGFDSVGKPFDPNVHEAMQQMETGEFPPNHVAQEMVRGFTLHERLVRPALVIISKAPSAPAASGEPPKTE